MKQTTRRLRAIETRAREILERIDPDAEHFRFALGLWCGFKPAAADLDAAWRAAIHRAELVSAMMNTMPGPSPERDRLYPGARLDRLVSASLSAQKRAALERSAAFWKRFAPLRQAMFDDLAKRWEDLAATDPRLDGTVNGLEAAFASLEEEHGVTPSGLGDALCSTLVPQLRDPASATEPLRRPAGW
jgi:hypothetical protein